MPSEEDCMKKCGYKEITGILLNDPQWLKKEAQLAKCDACRRARREKETTFSLADFARRIKP